MCAGKRWPSVGGSTISEGRARESVSIDRASSLWGEEDAQAQAWQVWGRQLAFAFAFASPNQKVSRW